MSRSILLLLASLLAAGCTVEGVHDDEEDVAREEQGAVTLQAPTVTIVESRADAVVVRVRNNQAPKAGRRLGVTLHRKGSTDRERSVFVVVPVCPAGADCSQASTPLGETWTFEDKNINWSNNSYYDYSAIVAAPGETSPRSSKARANRPQTASPTAARMHVVYATNPGAVCQDERFSYTLTPVSVASSVGRNTTISGTTGTFNACTVSANETNLAPGRWRLQVVSGAWATSCEVDLPGTPYNEHVYFRWASAGCSKTAP